jgi:hypothetical protein
MTESSVTNYVINATFRIFRIFMWLACETHIVPCSIPLKHMPRLIASSLQGADQLNWIASNHLT